MRRTLPDDGDATFDQILLGATSSLWRFEQQRQYFIDDEDGLFTAFQRGELIEPTQAPGLRAWYRQVREQTQHGIYVERVRVVDTPPTPYQRWLQYIDRWNREAGEVIEYLPRWALEHHTGISGLTAGNGQPFVGCDWWLIDQKIALIIHYDAEGRRTEVEALDSDPGTPMADRAELALAIHFAWRSQRAAEALRKEAASRAAA